MRSLIDLFENTETYPSEISGHDLAYMAMEWHHTPEDFNDGDIFQNITSFGKYRLQKLPVSLLDRGLYSTSDELINQYALLDTKAPPIIVDLNNKNVIDGNHRVKAAIKRGDIDILAYVGDESTYVPNYDDDDAAEWKPDESWR
jgi:hypothetical protein